MINKLITSIIIIVAICNCQNESKNYELADAYKGLRGQVLEITPEMLNLADDEPVLAVLMETGYEEAIVTLVATKDGSASLYFSNGGGVIGTGEHDNVSAVIKTLFLEAPKYLGKLDAYKKANLPKINETIFHFITPNGIFSATAKEELYGSNRHELSELFNLCHDLINNIRIASEKKG
ncbi:MAG: hypothetical protein OCD76_19295 [Reichenbachiella sp.]